MDAEIIVALIAFAGERTGDVYRHCDQLKIDQLPAATAGGRGAHT